MKRILIPLLLSLSFLAQAQTRRILFLGNSYTYYNNMPKIAADIAKSAGDTLTYDINAPGGYTLEGHSTNNTSINKIKQGNWDFVVLQEQSQLPSFPLSQVETEVFPYAKYLDSLINAHNTCAETVFYMTWGRKNGDASNCPFWPPVCTYDGMDSLLRQRYMIMADENAALVSPVGAAWHYIRQHYSAIELYDADESHPSPAGSYAAACSFYAITFRKDPSLITYNFTLNATEAANIRAAVKQVVYDSLSTWHVGDYDLVSDFSYSQLNATTFQFTNLSKNADGQLWDFGTASDTATNPTFSFPGPGTYIVRLKSFNKCDTTISEAEVIITTTGSKKLNVEKRLSIFPNPTDGELTFNINGIYTNIEITVTDVSGKILLKNHYIPSDRLQLDIKAAPGVYFAAIKVDDQVPVFVKVLKK